MWGYTFGQLAIMCIVIAGFFAIALIVLRKLKIEIPDWVRQIAIVIIVVLVGVIAIKFLLTLL